MDDRTPPASSGGIGFVGALTVAFIVLKLTGYIDWSWWWVWSPVWIAAIAFVVVIGLIGMLAFGDRLNGPR